MKVKQLVLLIFLSILLSGCRSTAAPARAINNAGMMYAMLYDYDSTPVNGASVYIDGKKRIESDMQGRFILEFKKSGEYSIRIEKPGYETIEDTFTYDPMNVLYFKMANASQLLVQAEEALDQYLYSEAEELVNRSLQLEPTKPEILFFQSIVFYQQGRHREAQVILFDLQSQGVHGEYITEFLNRITEE